MGFEAVQGGAGGYDQGREERGKNRGVPTIIRCGDWGLDWKMGGDSRGIPRMEVGASDGHVGLGGGFGAGWGEVALAGAQHMAPPGIRLWGQLGSQCPVQSLAEHLRKCMWNE